MLLSGKRAEKSTVGFGNLEVIGDLDQTWVGVWVGVCGGESRGQVRREEIEKMHV